MHNAYYARVCVTFETDKFHEKESESTIVQCIHTSRLCTAGEKLVISWPAEVIESTR